MRIEVTLNNDGTFTAVSDCWSDLASEGLTEEEAVVYLLESYTVYEQHVLDTWPEAARARLSIEERGRLARRAAADA